MGLAVPIIFIGPRGRHSSYLGAAAPPALGTIARNSNGSCERFSPACRCTPTQSIAPARRCVSFALPSGWVSRKCASVSHTPRAGDVVHRGLLMGRHAHAHNDDRFVFEFNLGIRGTGRRRRGRCLRHWMRTGPRMLRPARLRCECKEHATDEDARSRRGVFHLRRPLFGTAASAGNANVMRADTSSACSCLTLTLLDRTS